MNYWVFLSAKGRIFVDAWKRGDQRVATQAPRSALRKNEEPEHYFFKLGVKRQRTGSVH
jgi:hypothetical protein